MPTINVEMMQKLLQEFSEKETLTGEEIKVIEQQVQELEARIGICRDRLQNLNEDKDRLAAMMSRYIGGTVQTSLPPASPKPKPAPKIADYPQLADNSPGSAQPKDGGIIEDLEIGSTSEGDHSDASNENASAGGDDAIKSINDALKGLFRK